MSTISAITYDDAIAITPSDTAAQSTGQPFAALYTGTGGAIQLVVPSGTITLANLPAGVILPIATKWVKAASTTATGIFGLRAMPYKGA